MSVELIINNLYKIINMINSQITKAHDYLLNSHISYNLFNSLLINWLYYYTNISVIMSVKWKIIIISKLVGISEAICLILIFVKLMTINLTIVTFILSRYLYIYFMSFSNISNIIGIRNIHTKKESNSHNHKNGKYLPFYLWLAGLIDGDGYFLLTKKGYSSCEITMDARDAKALYEIKHKYGGTIKYISNASAVRYKIRHK